MILSEAIEKLNELEKAAYALGHAQSILFVDGDTVAPKNSWKGRGKALSYVGELMYRQLVNPETGEVLETILQHKDETDEVTFRRAEVMKESYDDLHILPMEEFVAYQELTNESSAVWHDAKEKSDWNMFAPYLEKLIAARRRFASLKDPAKPAYDILLDQYEKGAVMADLDPFFRTLREELSPVIREVAAREKPVPAFMKGPWPIAQQRIFSDKLMVLEGLDPLNCAIGETEHPFTGGPNKWDIRITTHYHEEDPFSSMYSVIHEGGHALYEMDVRDDLQFTGLAGGVTMGVHESQSRFYENIIGRSRAFCAPLLKILKEVFPEQMKGVTEEELYSAINLSKPSLIRTEADELTYSLHVMIRYELEKAMIAGNLKVADIPGEWNRLYKDVLGVDVPDNRRGCLQDSHWSTGYIGYFPSYALGSAYGVQMLRQMEKTVDVWGTVAKGDLSPVTTWLTENIHQYGALKKPQDLLPAAMGGPLDAAVYTDYLKKKFSELYGL
ncbi:carboxypeptidase M32 [Aristaeella lactis]|uniref:Carboxypeptidase Taq n=1 Tax=Aristaeella lactis TaxID=3046383 RepID=A0AC61PK52_9FIRM|nr:carboxypeptidase M32 [Aristaeella lactis]QUA51840.1 carboxypeptidase M32 [Aristaeella lactis]SMC52088.1 carboxypeptidase Taq [Aristaeella lactis]